MSNGFVEKNAASIALIVAIIALLATAVPQLRQMAKEAQREKAAAAATAPGGMGPGMPGGMGPGMPGGMGPGMPGGMGGFGGFGGGMSDEYKAKLAERVTLLDAALAAAAPADKAQMQLKRDLAKLTVLRIEAGARRVSEGATEALLRERVAANCGADAIARNQAELELIQATDRLRAGKETFAELSKALAGYPNTTATDAQFQELVAAEMAR